MVELERFYEKRIFLVKHALYKVYSEKNTISLQDIFNTFFLIFDKQMALVLYREEEYRKYRMVFSTVKDPRYSSCFEDTVASFGIGNNSLNSKYLKDAFIDDSLHKLKPLNYGFLLFEVNKCDLDKMKVDFSLLDKDDKSFHLFSKLCDTLLDTPYSKTLGLANCVKGVFEKIKCGKVESDSIECIDPRFDVDNNYVKEKCFGLYQGVLDYVYRKICCTPIFSHKNKFPPNILFFVKTYEKRIERFIRNGKYCYDYQVSIIFSKSQREHVKKTFSLMRESFINGNRIHKEEKWQFPITKFSLEEGGEADCSHNEVYCSYEENKNFDDAVMAKKFWDFLRDENSIDLIVSSLESPFSENAVSLVDSVMSSGFSSIRDEPFLYGGFDRIVGISEIFYDEKSNEFVLDYEKINFYEDKYKEVLRVVSLYYLISAFTSESTNENLKVLMSPINISGSTIFCMSTSTVKNHENDGTWDLLYHFEVDMVRKATRKIRRKFKEEYFNLIESLIIRGLNCSIHLDKESESVLFDLVGFVNRLRRMISFSARFVPYDILVFDLNQPINYKDVILTIDIFGNPLFVFKQKNHFYLNSEDITPITNQILEERIKEMFTLVRKAIEQGGFKNE